MDFWRRRQWVRSNWQEREWRAACPHGNFRSNATRRAAQWQNSFACSITKELKNSIWARWFTIRLACGADTASKARANKAGLQHEIEHHTKKNKSDLGPGGGLENPVEG
jgi:hypothetical protein